MRIEYTNTFRDLFGYQISHQFRMPIVQVFFLFFAALTFFQWYQHVDFWVSAIGAALTYLGLWCIQAIFMLLLLIFTKRKTLTTFHVVTLMDEGFQEESPFNRTVAFWKGGILKVRRRAGCIAVYLTPLSAYLIPIRAFASKAEATQFQNELEARIRAA
jgi:hypothetical protein